MKAAETLRSLYEVSRCDVNFFQPSFQLKSKTRPGAKVKKQYHAPATPYHRLLASDQIPESTKQQLQAAFTALDPVQLLQQIRSRQQELVAAEESPSAATKERSHDRSFSAEPPDSLARGRSTTDTSETNTSAAHLAYPVRPV